MRRVLEEFGNRLTNEADKKTFAATMQKMEFSGPHPDSVTHGIEIHDLPEHLCGALHEQYMDLFSELESDILQASCRTNEKAWNKISTSA